jgi:2,4-dienoyl-CoA reductase-like NADH-dependent reductase (Old Yellow Enzyme family)/NADPH-dependent 2,4-dienoyl-CoA reductase/sulfur reductase-like enzyme
MREANPVFQPIQIGSMKLKNRIAFAPLLNMPRGEDFSVNEKTNEWFAARARGGCGFVMTGFVAPLSLLAPDAPTRFTSLAKASQVNGCKIIIQMGAGGPMSGTGPSAGPFPNEKAPKPTLFEMGGAPPLPVNEVTKEEIERIMNSCAMAAAKVKEFGFDGVQLHSTHGGASLFCSFVSPFYNKRTDEYGGSWENRLRFTTETLKRMREAVGPDFPLIVRFSADELLGDQGITIEDTVKYLVPAYEAAGVSALDVSQGSMIHSPQGINIPLYYPRGCFMDYAAAVKEVATVPVIGVGRILDLDMADKYIEEGKADIIYLGRQLTADPDTPNKYLSGKDDLIRKCIGCLEGCGTPCPINYDISPDALPLGKTDNPRKVLIIGGGAAGMEAARLSSQRGHKVTLIEKNPVLGGTVSVLAEDPLMAEFKNLTDYLGAEMRANDIDIRVCKEATPEAVDEIDPDVVIMATGASLRMPEIVKGAHGVVDHIKALSNKAAIGQKVVIWGLVYGAELAISLAEEGKDVTLIGEGKENAMASHTPFVRQFWVLRRLTDIDAVRVAPETQKLSNPRVLAGIKVTEVVSGRVDIVTENGSESLEYDTLIISRGRTSNDELFESLKAQGREIHKIGDCSKAANIHQAIWSANGLVRKI